MAAETSVPRSRRAFLGAAVGAAVATVAHALGRPEAVRAGSDGDVVLGGSNITTNQTGVYVTGDTNPAASMFLYTYGTGPALAAVSLGGYGADVTSTSTSGPAVRGTSFANQTGVQGISIASNGVQPPSSAHCGVQGYADAYNGTGVWGQAKAWGVRGETTTTGGVGGYFVAPTGGTGLMVTGRAKFNRSGIVNVAAGRSYADIAVDGGFSSSSMVLATIQGRRAGVAISSVRTNYPSVGKARIYLTKVASYSSRTPVGWFVVG